MNKLLWGPMTLALLLTGCTTLKPVDLPDETASAPADAPLWTELNAARPGDWFLLLNEGNTALDWRLRAIASATESLDLQTFLWKEDQTGLRFFRQILEAADRGVRVRLLLDDSFTVGENDLIYDFAQHPNIEFRIYNPFRHRPDSMALRQLLNLGEFSRIDHRMHNKTMIIDNRAVILGGRNLADEYFGQHETGNFRDMELLCAGTIAQRISRQFDAFWNNNWSFPAEQVLKRPPPENDLEQYRTVLRNISIESPIESPGQRKQFWIDAAAGGAPGRAVLLADIPAKSSPADHGELPNQLAHELIEWIDRAQEELILVSAYLIPTPELEAAVERAEKRGVDVRILTNSLQSNNHTAAHSAYRHHVHRLLRHGADLHEVRSHAKDRSHYMRMPVDDKKLGLHAKLMLIDRKDVFIGSANMDPRSLNLNTEIGLFIESPVLNQQLRELLEIDFDKRNAWHLQVTESGHIVWVSDEITRESQPADSAFQRLEDWFLGELPIEAKM